MKKLLNLSLRPLLLYALVVIILSIPVYFFIVNHIWVHELDKHHDVIRKKIQQQLNSLQLDEATLATTVQLWNHIQPGTRVTYVDPSSIRPDSFFTSKRYDNYYKGMEQFRGLSAYITINNKSYHVIIETNMEEANEILMALTGISLLFFLLLLAGFIVVNRKLSFRIWKPFYNTMGQLKNFDLDSQQPIQLEKSEIEEFEELNNTVFKLTKKNIATYRQQKEFTENASHELQTPLALIQARLDLLLQDETLSKKQYEHIESLNGPLKRVTRINKNLLLLAKIENQQFSDLDQINVSDILNQQLEIFSVYFEGDNTVIERFVTDSVFITSNKSLMEILFSNLLLNAIRHNDENGKIKVTLNSKNFVIANSGTTALSQERLFKRFSTTSDKPGTGIGLSIVKEICNRYDWKITYEFSNSMHIFRVNF